jgi:hypothetical protein
VFGAREFTFDPDGLSVRSGGTSFEIGLPLVHPVDLRRFPIVHIAASADSPATVRTVVRATLSSPESDGPQIPLRGAEITFDLHTEMALDRAAMLRLRFELPDGRTLRLRGTSLEPPAKPTPATVRQLPPGSLEQQLLALRHIREDEPAAIVLPNNVNAAALEPSDTENGDTHDAMLDWGVVALFAATLALARVRPPRDARARALVELVLVLAAPMWLIIGGHFTGRIDHLQAGLISATALYAASLAWPRNWRWNGSSCAWLSALAVIALACIVGFAFHRADTGLRPIGTAHVIRYLGWALIQQYLICAVCLERWRVLTGSAALAAYAGALCFALLHTPNSGLMLATFGGGLCWCVLYVRERALLPLAFSHAASAMILIALLPPEILLSAEVGARFFQ